MCGVPQRLKAFRLIVVERQYGETPMTIERFTRFDLKLCLNLRSKRFRAIENHRHVPSWQRHGHFPQCRCPIPINQLFGPLRGPDFPPLPGPADFAACARARFFLLDGLPWGGGAPLPLCRGLPMRTEGSVAERAGLPSRLPSGLLRASPVGAEPAR